MVKLVLLTLVAVVMALVIIAVYSQILLPLMRNTPVLPIFRGRPHIDQEIEGVNEELDDRVKVRELEEKRRKLGK